MKVFKIKIFLVIVTIICMLFATMGCGQKGESSDLKKEVNQSSDVKKEDQSKDAKKFKFVTVVKISGVSWFDRMEQGIKKFASDTGINAIQVGPQKADAALQVQLIEDLIAQKVDAICVVPNSPEALEPVLKKARDAGIVVIAHEGSNLKNIDYDIEAFDNKSYGEHLMENLAKFMGNSGDYAVFVGSLTAKTHNEWVDAAINLQKEKYPNMKLAVDKIESQEDQMIAYSKTRELLKANPKIKGIQGSSSSDAPGIALAVEEMGLAGKVHVVGTSLVSLSGKYLSGGSCDLISFWDPSDSGYLMNKLAQMVLEKKEIKNNMDLGIKGYNGVVLNGKVLSGKAWVDVTKDNMSDYNF